MIHFRSEGRLMLCGKHEADVILDGEHVCFKTAERAAFNLSGNNPPTVSVCTACRKSWGEKEASE